ncbi:hypothetical protein A2924_03750 [Candidatus Giovannonibacteria bacterium RIFCSPLOWO2_01_FULL_44_16]|uniref:Antitoxin n=1 Tax=Candidatus Giovannonibacteria bacterium RIFCSPLOWO2_01_FULL_44_16 TaxID=1798348 RepID=A0A1F5X2C2_9BACT|nr:MAG: hypothetical protein A2924_03750 [Candidatus Giovannonibacteria bacterium RIFCSPLOWO2_01_FULL_44_16]
MTTTIPVKKREYMRLKKLDKSFGKFVNYFRELTEIEEARKQIREKKTIPQEKLFKRLGI